MHKNSINKLCAAHTSSRNNPDICDRFCLYSSRVSFYLVLLFSFIHPFTSHDFNSECYFFLAFFAIRYEWNEVVSAHAGKLIHFCPISWIQWRIPALKCPFFILQWHRFSVMNCSNNMCEWILKAPNNNPDRSTEIWLWYWMNVSVPFFLCVFFFKLRIDSELMECIWRRKEFSTCQYGWHISEFLNYLWDVRTCDEQYTSLSWINSIHACVVLLVMILFAIESTHFQSENMAARW